MRAPVKLRAYRPEEYDVALDYISGLAGAAREQRRERDRKSTRLNSSHVSESRMPSSA